MREDVKSLPSFFKFIFLVLLFLNLFASAAETFKVTDIVFDKIERQNPSELLLTIGLKIGDTFTEKQLWDQIEKDIKRLYSIGEFEEVGPLSACRVEDFSGGKRVVFAVKEKLRINNVYIRGGKEVGNDELSKNVKTAKGRLVSEVDLQYDCQKMVDSCHSKGYLFAEVTPKLKSLPGATAEVTFDISLGPRTRIYDIQFIGNKTVSASELKAHMVIKERDFWFFGLLRKGYFDSQKLIRDIAQLRKYLRDTKGFLDATVGLDSVEFGPDREKMIVKIRIDEGMVYNLKGISLEIQSPLKKPHFKASKILSNVKGGGLIGQPYRGTKLRDLRMQIQELYQEDGYLNCRIHLQEPKIELKGNEATAVFLIEERNPVFARRIQIRGNKKTKDEVIRRALAFGPGQLVTSDKIRESRSNLFKLQIFDPTQVDIQPVESTATKEGTDFKVDVGEGLDGQLMVGLGLASDMGIIGSFVLRKKNFDLFDWPDSFWDIPNSFTGAGQIISFEAQPGTYYSHYRVSFTEPYLFGRWYGLNVYGEKSDSHRDSWDISEWGGGFRLDRYFTFNRDVAASLGYRFNVIDLGSIDADAPDDAREAAGVSRLSATTIGFRINKYLFDPYAGPYKGYRLWTNYEYAGGFLGADIDYSKSESGVACFLDIMKDKFGNHHVLTITGNFGWMEPHHNTHEIPIYERFWLGGPNSMRGFRFYGVGPHENGDEIGGIAKVYGNVEYSFPLFLGLVPLKFLRGVAFYDWGELEGPHYKNGVQEWDFDRLSMGRMRTSAGIGMRISLNPLGLQVPISLYWGKAIDKQPEDRTSDFLFHIGTIGF